MAGGYFRGGNLDLEDSAVVEEIPPIVDMSDDSSQIMFGESIAIPEDLDLDLTEFTERVSGCFCSLFITRGIANILVPAFRYLAINVRRVLNKYHIFTGWLCRLSPRGNIVNRGGAELYRMSHFYNKFQRRETLPCDIQNCQPANWPISLLEINMRYNNSN